MLETQTKGEWQKTPRCVHEVIHKATSRRYWVKKQWVQRCLDSGNYIVPGAAGKGIIPRATLEDVIASVANDLVVTIITCSGHTAFIQLQRLDILIQGIAVGGTNDRILTITRGFNDPDTIIVDNIRVISCAAINRRCASAFHPDDIITAAQCNVLDPFNPDGVGIIS